MQKTLKPIIEQLENQRHIHMGIVNDYLVVFNGSCTETELVRYYVSKGPKSHSKVAYLLPIFLNHKNRVRYSLFAAKRVLKYFEARSKDQWPQKSIALTTDWLNGAKVSKQAFGTVGLNSTIASGSLPNGIHNASACYAGQAASRVAYVACSESLSISNTETCEDLSCIAIKCLKFLPYWTKSRVANALVKHNAACARYGLSLLAKQ